MLMNCTAVTMPLGVHPHTRLIPSPRCSSFPLQRISPHLNTATFLSSSYNPRRQISLPLSPLRSQRSSDQDLLQAALSSSDDGGSPRTHLPAVRSYESDLVRLTLIGDVGYDQAITAAAADGGDAAQEHLESGTPTMVVETLFPGSSDENSTISTRLFLPAAEVKNRARSLRSRTTAGSLSESVSRNILAMTFRQVVLQRVWSFELAIFPPGIQRNMNDLPNPREVSAFCTLSSSESKVLAAVAGAVCSLALNNVGKECFGTVSADAGVCISKLPVSKIMKKARSMIGTLDLACWKPAARNRTLKHKWWVPPTYPSLEKSLGSGVNLWVNEHVQAYRIQVDGAKFMKAKFQGWQRSIDNNYDVLLTFSQMVELANILDMLFEDRFTAPKEQLFDRFVGKIPKPSSSQNPLWDWTLGAVVSGCFLLAIGVMAGFGSLGMFNRKEAIGSKHIATFISKVDSYQTLSLEVDKLDSLCVYIIRNIKDAFHYHGDIMSDLAAGAWIGELPECLQKSNNDADQELHLCNDQGPTSFRGEEGDILGSNTHSLSEEKRINQMISVQDVATYQVVLSADGKVIGFQPTNRVAVNHWAANPLTKILYHGQTPSPSLLEPSLKIPQPQGVFLFELFLSINPKSWFALARPLRY